MRYGNVASLQLHCTTAAETACCIAEERDVSFRINVCCKRKRNSFFPRCEWNEKNIIDVKYWYYQLELEKIMEIFIMDEIASSWVVKRSAVEIHAITVQILSLKTMPKSVKLMISIRIYFLIVTNRSHYYVLVRISAGCHVKISTHLTVY